MAIFGVNLVAWNALPPDLKALLGRELPKLEAAIWTESERETAIGLACNTGAKSCGRARPGHMVVVPLSAPDERRRQEIFRTTVLPRWIARCSVPCADVWNQTIGPARGILTPVLK